MENDTTGNDGLLKANLRRVFGEVEPSDEDRHCPAIVRITVWMRLGTHLATQVVPAGAVFRRMFRNAKSALPSTPPPVTHAG